jgi:hypothetical protein
MTDYWLAYSDCDQIILLDKIDLSVLHPYFLVSLMKNDFIEYRGVQYVYLQKMYKSGSNEIFIIVNH